MLGVAATVTAMALPAIAYFTRVKRPDCGDPRDGTRDGALNRAPERAPPFPGHPPEPNRNPSAIKARRVAVIAAPVDRDTTRSGRAPEKLRNTRRTNERPRGLNGPTKRSDNLPPTYRESNVMNNVLRSGFHDSLEKRAMNRQELRHRPEQPRNRSSRAVLGVGSATRTHAGVGHVEERSAAPPVSGRVSYRAALKATPDVRRPDGEVAAHTPGHTVTVCRTTPREAISGTHGLGTDHGAPGARATPTPLIVTLREPVYNKFLEDPSQSIAPRATIHHGNLCPKTHLRAASDGDGRLDTTVRGAGTRPSVKSTRSGPTGDVPLHEDRTVALLDAVGNRFAPSGRQDMAHDIVHRDPQDMGRGDMVVTTGLYGNVQPKPTIHELPTDIPVRSTLPGRAWGARLGHNPRLRETYKSN